MYLGLMKKTTNLLFVFAMFLLFVYRPAKFLIRWFLFSHHGKATGKKLLKFN